MVAASVSTETKISGVSERPTGLPCHSDLEPGNETQPHSLSCMVRYCLYSVLFAAGAGPKPASASAGSAQTEDVNLEGEKVFRANCGRCHQAPHKLSPAMMRTAIRHMRVRATITDEDMRVILAYMTR